MMLETSKRVVLGTVCACDECNIIGITPPVPGNKDSPPGVGVTLCLPCTVGDDLLPETWRQLTGHVLQRPQEMGIHLSGI